MRKCLLIIGSALFILGTLILQPISTSANGTRVEVNIFQPNSIGNGQNLAIFQKQLGISFHSAKWYQDWSEPFNSSIAKSFHDSGFVPELTWQPQQNDSQGVAYNDVTSGKYDSYLTASAQVVKNLGFTLRISLAPEMNTDWVAWGLGKQGNTAENHKAFWQYVVKKFRDNGANNVDWIWSPNIVYNGAPATYGQMYPGDGYVTYLGLDGYNWGTTQSWSAWQSFKEIFQPSYRSLTALTSKKILIMETASTEIGGDKAAWITDMFGQLKNGFSQIQGFTWFDINKETDWRIESSQASREAFVQAVQGTSVDSSTASQISKKSKSNNAGSKTPDNNSTIATTDVSVLANSFDSESAYLFPPPSPTLVASQKEGKRDNPIPALSIIYATLGTLLIFIGGLVRSKTKQLNIIYPRKKPDIHLDSIFYQKP